MLLKLYQPRPQLKNYISMIWSFESENGIPINDLKQIVPNGELKLIVPYKNKLKSRIDGKETTHKESSIIVVGQMTSSAFIDGEGQVGTLGIMFKPSLVYRIFQIGLHELTNFTLSLEDIFGSTGSRLLEVVANEEKVEDKIRVIENFLIDQIEYNNKTNHLYEHAVESIIKSNGLLNIYDIVDDTGYSKKHLERLFKTNIGVLPKTFSKIFRFYNIYKSLNLSEEEKNSLDGVYDYYYDQAHFIKEFKHFTGITPGHFSRQTNNFGKIFLKQ